MEKQAFTVYYNGKNVSVTVLDDNTFMFQVTYKPVYIKLMTDSNGQKIWHDLETNQETMLSKEIGKLIESHPFAFAGVLHLQI